MATARTARWWMITAGLVAAGACTTALAGSVPASSYLLSVKNLPRGFSVQSRTTLSRKELNASGGTNPCTGAVAAPNHAHYTSGAEIVFANNNDMTNIDESVVLGAPIKGVQLDMNAGYAQFLTCRTVAMDGLNWTISPTTAVHRISNGARVGVVVLSTTYQGLPFEAGLALAQRGHAGLTVLYGDLMSNDVHLADRRTLSFALRAIGRLPRH